jgi:hypothetical protein
VVASSQIDEIATKTLFTSEDLTEFELLIYNNLDYYLQQDLASTLAGLVKLGHMPNKIIGSLVE